MARSHRRPLRRRAVSRCWLRVPRVLRPHAAGQRAQTQPRAPAAPAGVILQQQQHLTRRREAAARRSPGQRAAPYPQPPRNLAEFVGIQAWSRASGAAGAWCLPVCSCAEAQMTGRKGECWTEVQRDDQGRATLAWMAGNVCKASEPGLRKRSVRPTSSAHVYTCARLHASSATPPLAEAMPRLESLIHPSIFMAMAPPVCAAAPRRSREDRDWSR